MRFCPACGAQLDGSPLVACPQCGASLTGLPEAAQIASAPAPAVAAVASPVAPSLYRPELASQPGVAAAPSSSFPAPLPKRYATNPKSAAVAAVLEFLIAGVGFMYVGKAGRGIVILVGSIGALVASYFYLIHLFNAAGCLVNGVQALCFPSPETTKAQTFQTAIIVVGLIWAVLRIGVVVSMAKKTQRAR